jgi:hypothetical protein
MNRKLLYVLMSAGHRHKFVRTNDEVHTCRVCGRAEEHNWVEDETKTFCKKCSKCAAVKMHSFASSGQCEICGYLPPATLVSGTVTARAGSGFTTFDVEWQFNRGGIIDGSIVVSGSYIIYMRNFDDPSGWSLWTERELSPVYRTAAMSGCFIELDQGLPTQYGDMKIITNLTIEYLNPPAELQTISVTGEDIIPGSIHEA